MEKSVEICQELSGLAENIRSEVEQSFNQIDSITLITIFIETIRTRDFYEVFNFPDSNGRKLSIPEFDIIKMGWNNACSFLFKEIMVNGFPLFEHDIKSLNYTSGLLYKLGCTSIIKRAIDMVDYGFLKVSKAGNCYTFETTSLCAAQYLDKIEFYKLEKINHEIKSNTSHIWGLWNLVDEEELEKAMHKPGNFFYVNHKDDFGKHLKDDIDSLMIPLVQPWNSGRGKMIKYDTTEEIDYHFLAKAMELVISWRNEVGLHPKTDINGVSGAELSIVTAILVSLHIKHLNYVKLAIERFKNISIPQSLTLWGQKEQLIQEISIFSELDTALVEKVLDLISLKSKDSKYLYNHTTQFMPIIVDLGNGFIIRPVSSILHNPFTTILHLAEFRNPNIRHSISEHKEELQRNNLQALFFGTRYIIPKGNIKIRVDGKILTDIDAVVYDTLSGDIALFQLKWQDYFTNDVKKLRSKIKNLCNELDDWAVKISEWINKQGKENLSNCLRLDKTKPISAIYLFAISNDIARLDGYGYKIGVDNLAISNWPQFSRIRSEIGPTGNIFRKLFEKIKSEPMEQYKCKPLPAEFNLTKDVQICFPDLWNIFDENYC